MRKKQLRLQNTEGGSYAGEILVYEL